VIIISFLLISGFTLTSNIKLYQQNLALSSEKNSATESHRNIALKISEDTEKLNSAIESGNQSKLLELADGFNSEKEVSNQSKGYAAEWFGIKYMPVFPYNLKKVELIAGEGSGEFIIQLRPDNNGFPSDIVFREVNFTMVDHVSWQGGEFTESYSLEADTTYWIVFNPVNCSQPSIARSGRNITHTWNYGQGWVTKGTVYAWMIKFYTEYSYPEEMPLVYVADPQNISALPGETFITNIKVFNLTKNFFKAKEEWKKGNCLPPPGEQYNYSLGNLIGLDIKFSWDSTLLKYENHTVKIPVEEYSEGVLHKPIMVVKDLVNQTTGVYHLSIKSENLSNTFNCPNTKATIFTITFSVIKNGTCELNLSSVELIIPSNHSQFRDAQPIIPHLVKHGCFRTPTLTTRLVKVEVGALVGEKLVKPVIYGENCTAQIKVRNEGEIVNLVNLTLSNGTDILKAWMNQYIEVDEQRNYTCTLMNLNIGIHAFTVKAHIVHNNTKFTDELNKIVKVIATPRLYVEGPSTSSPGETITFNAKQSVHEDPEGEIKTYVWTLWKPQEAYPHIEYSGINFNHELSQKAEKGFWRIVLVVTDNWGITYSPIRSASTAYKKEFIIEIQNFDSQRPKISIISPENKTYTVDCVSLTFILNEAVSWMGYNVDDQNTITIVGNTTVAGLSDGKHVITIFANDTTGNLGSEAVFFTVDTSNQEPLSAWVITAIVATLAVGSIIFISIRRFRTRKLKRSLQSNK
jgi:hypothetical protein